MSRAPVGRNPEGRDRADGLGAEHEHAVPKAGAQTLTRDDSE